MVSLSTMLKKLVTDLYYNILEIVVISLIYSVFTIPCFCIKYLIFKETYIFVILIPLFIGIMYAIDMRISTGFKISYKNIFIGVRKYYSKSIILSIVLAIFSTILYSSYRYFMYVRNLFSLTGLVLQIFVFIMIILICIYSMPLIIKENISTFEALKQGLKIFSDNVLYSVCFLIQILSVFILMGLTVISIPLLFSGVLCMFILENYNNVVKKYSNLNS